ncbi:MAG: hypothetical protein GY719_38865 [bacterium]|nr:hypothetical protein [bacterium]
MAMLPTLSLFLALTALAAAAALLVLSRRAAGARRELAERMHDQAMALDQRCDVLQQQLDVAARDQRIDHLLTLVDVSERQGRLDGAAARRLELYALELREEARLV